MNEFQFKLFVKELAGLYYDEEYDAIEAEKVSSLPEDVKMEMLCDILLEGETSVGGRSSLTH
jgi:hypothetical protein